MCWKITRVMFFVSLAAFVTGACLAAVAFGLNANPMNDAATVDRIEIAGAILFYPGMCGFLITVIILGLAAGPDK